MGISDYQHLLARISVVYTASRLRAHQAVNAQSTDHDLLL
jgi:hypothetical protein